MLTFFFFQFSPSLLLFLTYPLFTLSSRHPRLAHSSARRSHHWTKATHLDTLTFALSSSSRFNPSSGPDQPVRTLVLLLYHSTHFRSANYSQQSDTSSARARKTQPTIPMQGAINSEKQPGGLPTIHHQSGRGKREFFFFFFLKKTIMNHSGKHGPVFLSHRTFTCIAKAVQKKRCLSFFKTDHTGKTSKGRTGHKEDMPKIGLASN